MTTNARLAGRNGEVWKAYIRGEVQVSIAERFELTPARVSQIIKADKASIPEEDKADLRQMAAELYTAWLLETAKLVDADPIPAYSNGRPIIGKDGQVVEDHSG